MELEIVNIKGEKTGKKVKLPAAIFGITPNEHVVYLDVKRIQAANRQGTHKTKERSEITGSTKKLRKQKGSGMARVGDIKSPIFRGGGRIFGPKPRNYQIKLNKKETQLARKSALSQKAIDKHIIVIEDFNMESPKTKDFTNIINKLEVNGQKALFVFDTLDRNVLLSARNIPGISVHRAAALNTYNILNNQKLILAESALESLNKTLN
jgi:large subunit ribosomal protein L4